MTIENIGSNMTEVTKSDGKIVLISYSTPVAAFIPPSLRDGDAYILVQREGLASSRTTAKHIAKWRSFFLRKGEVDIVESTAQAVQAILDE